MSKVAQWLGQPREGGKFESCPLGLMPTVYQNATTGSLELSWPDVCYCPANGGPEYSLHELQANCSEVEWPCNCPGEDHTATCPYDVCPIAQCHPMCSQVTGDSYRQYCHCPCHG